VESIVWLYSIEKISRWHINLSESLRFPVFIYFAVSSIGPKYPCKIPLSICKSLVFMLASELHAFFYIYIFFWLFSLIPQLDWVTYRNVGHYYQCRL